MKATATLRLYMSRNYSCDTHRYEWEPDIWACAIDDSESRIFVREFDIDFDVPDDFDPTAAQIKALEAEKAKAGAEFAKLCATINDKLAKLQAIGCEVAA